MQKNIRNQSTKIPFKRKKTGIKAFIAFSEQPEKQFFNPRKNILEKNRERIFGRISAKKKYSKEAQIVFGEFCSNILR